MIIVHVHHTFYPVIGGLERAVQKLAEAQARLGHEIHVVTGVYGASGRPRKELIGDVYVHRMRTLKLHYTDLSVPLEVPIDILKKADIVHIHSHSSYFNIRIAEIAKRIGKPVATHFMAVDTIHDHPNSIVRLLGPYYTKYMLRKALQLTELKLTRSLRDLELLRERYGVEKVYFLPDGIDKDFIEKAYMENEFRRKYSIYEDIILYIGRLHRLKGLNILVRASSIVVKRYRDVKFIIIGPGNSSEYLELAKRLSVNDKIMFLGVVDEITKIGALDAAVSLVLPSISNYVEVYPMVISEAWARKRPVIASAVGGIPYRVKHMENGILVPPKSPEKLAEAVLTLLENKELAKRLGEAGFNEVKTWEQIAELSVALYKETLEKF